MLSISNAKSKQSFKIPVAVIQNHYFNHQHSATFPQGLKSKGTLFSLKNAVINLRVALIFKALYPLNIASIRYSVLSSWLNGKCTVQSFCWKLHITLKSKLLKNGCCSGKQGFWGRKQGYCCLKLLDHPLSKNVTAQKSKNSTGIPLYVQHASVTKKILLLCVKMLEMVQEMAEKEKNSVKEAFKEKAEENEQVTGERLKRMFKSH